MVILCILNIKSPMPLILLSNQPVRSDRVVVQVQICLHLGSKILTSRSNVELSLYRSQLVSLVLFVKVFHRIFETNDFLANLELLADQSHSKII